MSLWTPKIFGENLYLNAWNFATGYASRFILLTEPSITFQAVW